MANKKADNTWYGKGFERSIEGVFNNVGILNLDKIPTQKAKDLAIQAQSYINQYNILVEPMHSCIWTGQHTHNEDGDLIVNGHADEVKHVQYGKGTYLGTSWETVCLKYGLEYLHPQTYLKETGLYNKLSEYCGEKNINYINQSPVTIIQSKKIRENKEFYDPYKKYEEDCRKQLNILLCKDLQNEELRKNFLMDFITKTISDKHMPDYYLVYNYKLDKITYIYTKKQLLEMAENLTFTPSELGGNIGYFRFQLGWQNGAGLNNPTIRFYIN